MDRARSVHVVISVFNGWDKTKICLDALEGSSARGLKVIVVDHGSTNGASSTSIHSPTMAPITISTCAVGTRDFRCSSQLMP